MADHPERVGPYPLIEEIGRGGMGTVYRAVDPKTSRPVVIKLMTAGRRASAIQRKRFEREGQLLAKLSLKHVVRVFDAGEHEGVPYLVLDQVEGQSLQEGLRLGPMPVDGVIHVGERLARTLHAVHQAGLIHRDLKPENVILTPAGEPVLIDFGLGKDLAPREESQALTRSGQALGTPHFWAPEQARTENDRIGPATDVYALGATLYSCLVGRPPFYEAETLVELTHQTCKEPPPPLRAERPEVPEELERLVLWCLAKEPEQRPPDAGVVADALAALATARRPRAKGAGPATRRWIGVAVAAGGLASFALTGVLLSARHGESRAVPPATSLAQRAEAGEVPAMLALARALASGSEGTTKDEAAAARWLRKAAGAGEVAAMYELSLALAEGRGVPREPVEAARWLRSAALGEHPQAMLRWARSLEAGAEGVHPDPAEAARWYRKAADAGEPAAMGALGALYATGRGLPRDDAEALRWIRRGVEREDPRAMTWLGVFLSTERGGLGRDRDEALRWLRRGAEGGEPRALAGMGECYALGRGVPVDYAEALRWLRKAEAAGEPAALTWLGYLHLEGLGVAKDPAAAFRYFFKAAQTDDDDAMTYLGALYAEGSGVEHDDREAMRWYRRSAELGNGWGMACVGAFYLWGRGGVSRDEAEARRWYQRALDAGFEPTPQFKELFRR
ncbi:MAG: protein kinase [Planctomycetota bacterium]